MIRKRINAKRYLGQDVLMVSVLPGGGAARPFGILDNSNRCEAAARDLPDAAARITRQCAPDGAGLLPGPSPLLPRIA